jgi:predicted nucleic acid-binding protein
VNAYLDSSVILKKVLGQAGALREWSRLGSAVVSAIAEVECLRTLDRLRLRKEVSDARLSRWREAVFRLLAEASVVEVTRPVLERASQPMPTSVGTLHAIHLASALLWREHEESDLAFATHDEALAVAARAFGFPVLGA